MTVHPISDELLHVAVRLAGDDAEMLARIEAIVDGPPADPLHRLRVEAACWRDHCSPGQVALEMAEQMDEVERLVIQRVREASWDVSGAYPWAHLGPSHAELQERRGDGE